MYKCDLCDEPFDTNQKLQAHRHNKHEREYPRGEIKHGTVAGYASHRRRKDLPCAECRKAWRDYYSKSKKSSKG